MANIKTSELIAATLPLTGDELVDLLKGVVAQDGMVRQRLLVMARSRLAAGALMSRL